MALQYFSVCVETEANIRTIAPGKVCCVVSAAPVGHQVPSLRSVCPAYRLKRAIRKTPDLASVRGTPQISSTKTVDQPTNPGSSGSQKPGLHYCLKPSAESLRNSAPADSLMVERSDRHCNDLALCTHKRLCTLGHQSLTHPYGGEPKGADRKRRAGCTEAERETLPKDQPEEPTQIEQSKKLALESMPQLCADMLKAACESREGSTELIIGGQCQADRLDLSEDRTQRGCRLDESLQVRTRGMARKERSGKARVNHIAERQADVLTKARRSAGRRPNRVQNLNAFQNQHVDSVAIQIFGAAVPVAKGVDNTLDEGIDEESIRKLVQRKMAQHMKKRLAAQRKQ